MAREILFKAKRIDNGEWVYWNLYGELCGKSAKRTRLSIKNGATTHYYDYIHQVRSIIDEKTICEYTGLNDKNGNKIWENDIVIGDFGWHKGKYTIRWFDSKAKFDFPTDSIINRNEYEVIGNIFDNPKLLEGGA